MAMDWGFQGREIDALDQVDSEMGFFFRLGFVCIVYTYGHDKLIDI